MSVDADFRLLRKELNAIREELRTLRRGALPSKGSGDTVLQNEAYIYFTGTGDDAGYIGMTAGNDLTIGNFANGERVLLVGKDSGGTERSIAFSVDNTTDAPQLVGQEGLRLVADGTGADVKILAPGDITIDADTNIIMPGLPTADQHVVGALWRSTNDVKISTG